MKTHFILYVSDQKKSAEFYSAVLGEKSILDVPGMTEFKLGSETVLGLMPEASASRLLGPKFFPPTSSGTPKAELYLIVDDPAAFHDRALAAGALEISPLSNRDWGHEAAYSLDTSGHVLAFAREIRQ